jgi:hypothetical protein
MQNKYTLKELEDMDVLPDDCNAIADAYARQFKDPGLIVAMNKMRRREITKGYGEVNHLGKDGRPDAIFSFQKGVCKHASPLIWIDTFNVVKGSIKFY